MAKRTIDFGDYKEPTWEEYTGEDPRPNQWYTGVVKRARYDEDGDQVIFIIEISEGEFKGWGRGWYAPLEGNLKWKAQEIIKAIQGGKTTPVTLDWENETAVANWLKKAKPIKFKTESYNDKITIRKVTPLLSAVGTPAPAPGQAEAEVPTDTDKGDDEPLEDYTEDELNAMSQEELEELLMEEFEVPEDELPEEATGRGAAAKNKKALVAMVLEVQAEGGEDTRDTEDAEGDEGEDDTEFADGFDDGTEEPEADPEPEPEPEPAKPARRGRATKAAAPAPAPEPAPAARGRRARR